MEPVELRRRRTHLSETLRLSCFSICVPPSLRCSRAALHRAAIAANLPVGTNNVVTARYTENDLLVPGTPPRLLCRAMAGVAQDVRS